MESDRNMEGFSNDQLVIQAKKGDKGDIEAFEELDPCYKERICQLIFRLTRNHLDVDDLKNYFSILLTSRIN